MLFCCYTKVCYPFFDIIIGEEFHVPNLIIYRWVWHSTIIKPEPFSNDSFSWILGFVVVITTRTENKGHN